MLAPIPPRAGPVPDRRPRAERRRHGRLAPSRPSLCRIAPPDGPPAAAFVHNLSASGAALFSESPFPIGSTVRVALVNNAAIYCLMLELTVLRCQPTLTGDWFLAGMFDRMLTPAELMPFLL